VGETLEHLRVLGQKAGSEDCGEVSQVQCPNEPQRCCVGHYAQMLGLGLLARGFLQAMQSLCRARIHLANECYGSGETTDHSDLTFVALPQKNSWPRSAETLVWKMLFLAKTSSGRQSILTQTYLFICTQRQRFRTSRLRLSVPGEYLVLSILLLYLNLQRIQWPRVALSIAARKFPLGPFLAARYSNQHPPN
jgi:hypothetical protein